MSDPVPPPSPPPSGPPPPSSPPPPAGGQLRIVVDRAACRGYANCLDVAPDVFDLDEHDIAVTNQDRFPATERDRLERAVDRCPARALSLEDLTGRHWEGREGAN